MEDALLAVDVGTTHCKAGLFGSGGESRVARHRTPVRQGADGYLYYDPDELWRCVCAVLTEVLEGSDVEGVAAVGVASMAEAGLLLDGTTGEPRSPVLPWFDMRPAPHARRLEQEADARERFAVTGLRPSHKYGLAKLLWLREQGAQLDGGKWLSVADWVAYRLSGRLGTDHSLAARTYAYRIHERHWDEDLLSRVGLCPDLFPEAREAGEPLGTVTSVARRETGLSGRTRVAVSGHDHVCAALALGAVEPGVVVNSIGTAETLIGGLESLELGDEQWESGLAYGPHVVPDRYCWIGGLPSSGGSVAWLAALTGLQPEEVPEQGGDRPTGILYFPWLSGSGAPRPESSARAAFVGLSEGQGSADLLTAVLEGIAYEIESIRRAAERVSGKPLCELAVTGGGTRGRNRLQVKADVSNCRLRVPAGREATLLGAAMAVADRCGGCEPAGPEQQGGEVVMPDPERHELYREIYERGYLPLQEPLRAWYRDLEARRQP